PIRGDGVAGGGFGSRLINVAVQHPARRCKHDRPRPHADGVFQDVKDSQEVDLGVEHRFANRTAHRQLGRLVKDGFGTHVVKHTPDPVSLADVDSVQMYRSGKVVATAAAEVIEHRDSMPAAKERIHDMAADKSGATGNKNPHSTPFEFQSGWPSLIVRQIAT